MSARDPADDASRADDSHVAAGIAAELSPRFLRGLDLFDAGDWYEAHEELEELWSGEVGATRHVLQALIQLAVALLHRERGNFAGAASLFERAIEHLDAVLEPTCRIEPRALRERVRRLLAEVETARAANGEAPRFDPELVPDFTGLRTEVRAARAALGLPQVG